MERNYKCEFCQNIFKTKAYLNKHKKSAKYCLLLQNQNNIIETSSKNLNLEDDTESLKIETISEVDVESPKIETTSEVDVESPKIETTSEVDKKENVFLYKKKLKDLTKQKEDIEKEIIDVKKYQDYLKNTENTILNYLSTVVKNSNFSGNKVIYILIDLMKFINNYNIQGSDKKSIILSVLKDTENIFNFDEQTKTFIEHFSGELIDIIVSVDKKNITLKNLESCFLPLCI